MTRTKIVRRRGRRERQSDNGSPAWTDYADAVQRLHAARERLTELSELVDQARDDHHHAVQDAAEALRRVALPLDRHAA